MVAGHSKRHLISEESMKRWMESFPGGSVVKNAPANAGDTGSSPDPGRSHVLSPCANND